MNECLASAIGLMLVLPHPAFCSGAIAATTAVATRSPVVAASPVSSMSAVDDVAIVRSQIPPSDLSGRLTDAELSIVELKQDVKTNLFLSLGIAFAFGKKMDAEKAETNKKMDEAKAETNRRMDEADERMLVMFVVTTGVAVLAALKQ